MPVGKSLINKLILSMAVAVMPAWGAPVVMAADESPPQEAGEAAPAAKNAKALEDVHGALAGGDAKEVAKKMETLAKSGNAKAQVMIGDFYLEGKGVTANNSIAWHWYKRAAENEDTDGQFKLAELYRTGAGVPFSLPAAAEWYAKAAEKGYLPAQKSLGLLYAGKFGSAGIDKKKAAEWLDAAAKQGDVGAERALDELYDGGYAPPSKQDQALSADEADINTDVGFIHMVITNAVNAMAPPNGTLKMNGLVRVVEQDQGWFAVSIPDFKIEDRSGYGFSFADSGLRIKPEDGNIKDARAYRISATLPDRVRATVADMNNNLKLVITHNQKRFNGLWYPESNRFAEADIELADISIKAPEKSVTVTADRFAVVSNWKEVSPGTWSGPSQMEIAKIAVTTPNFKLASLESIVIKESMKIISNIEGFDGKSLADGIRLISQKASPAFGPGASKELTKKIASAALRMAPNLEVDVRLADLKVNDDKGNPVGSLDGLNFSAAWGLEMPYAAVSLAYAHNNLKTGVGSRQSQTITPYDVAASIKVERLPIETVLGALFDQQSFSAADIRGPLAQAGTKIITKANMDAVKAKLTLDGMLKADAASVYGVSGSFDLVVKGISKIQEAVTEDPKNVEPIFLLLANMVSDLATVEPGSGGEDTAKLHIDMTADGKVLINGNDMASAPANK